MDPALTWRALAILVAASAVFTVLSPAVHRRDPGRRKRYLAVLAAALLVIPWWSLAGLWSWPLGVQHPERWLTQPVPWLLLWLWWVVGAARILRSVLRVAAGRRLLNRLPPLHHASVHEDLHTLAKSLGLEHPIELRQGPEPCASTLGTWLVVLPAAARHWPRGARQAVLGHELAHLSRRDDRLLLGLRLLIDWYWWMPWLTRLYDRYLEAMEESCDDAASHLLGDRAAYVAGLVQAARSLRRSASDAVPWPAWVSLLGHSHLTVRAERLLTRPRPTLDHADGRWTLLWASLAIVVLLTARPAPIPDHLPASAELFPLRPAATAAAPRHARVETRSYLQDWRTGTWRRLPASARNPLPVYPAGALRQGLEGTVTVELELTAGPSGWLRPGPPTISSSDPSGLLRGAVERVFALAGHADLGASLRTLAAHNNRIDRPPPGTSLRLRQTYRFVAGAAQSSEGG